MLTPIEMSPYNVSIPLNKKITSNTYQKYPKQDFKRKFSVNTLFTFIKGFLYSTFKISLIVFFLAYY